MSNDDLITDDFVAEMLAKEAADQSLKYSSMGMDGPRGDKKPTNMPKPNTRFLQRIIKSTNSHNANLLANETAESRARLKKLEREEERQKRKTAAPQDIRRRQMGDIRAILGGGRSGTRAKSASTPGEASSSARKRRDDDRSAPPESRKSRRRHRERRGDSESDSERDAGRKARRHHRRSRSPHERERHHRHRSSSSEDGKLSSKSRRSGSDRNRLRHNERRSTRETEEGRSSRSSTGRRDGDKIPVLQSTQEHHARSQPRERSASDSDPLEDVIGPAPPPPVRVRGRGFQSGSSGIDKRFEADYDPKADAELEESADNWDDSVEAFRDRKKWEQHQEQRLRAAGFDDAAIGKWRKGGERNEEDVTWTKAGEKREWDRGKEGELSGIFSADN